MLLKDILPSGFPLTKSKSSLKIPSLLGIVEGLLKFYSKVNLFRTIKSNILFDLSDKSRYSSYHMHWVYEAIML